MKQKLFTLFFALVASVSATLATTTEITVAKALEIGAALSEGTSTDETYDIVGYVTQIDDNSFNTSYKNMVFWIADSNNGAATNAAGAFEVYRGKPTQELKVGDKVSVKTKIQNYKGTIESIQSAPVTLLEEGTGEGSGETSAADVVFDKNYFAGQGVSYTGGTVSAEKNGVTFTCDKGFGDGQYVRCYKGSTVTITSATEQIAKIEFDFATLSGTSYDGGLDPVTVVNAKGWTVTAAAQIRFKKISIYFGTAEDVVASYDTVTIAEALVIGEALADNGYSDKKYAVVGYVANAKVFGEKYEGAQTFFMSDDATATLGDFTAYNCNVAAPGVVPGDYVAVVGKIQKYVGNSGTPTIEITSGKVVKNPFWFQYTIKGIANIEEAGTVIIDRTPIYYCHKITAAPNYGYHFVKWNDGNTENPRSFILTQDTVFTAEFAHNPIITYVYNSQMGTVSGPTITTTGVAVEYITFKATPNYGCHFTQWSDGLKDNPRIAQITQDTTFTAEFAYNRVGTCGKDLALVWSYDPTNKVLTIGNAGEFTENMQFGVEAQNEMEELVIGNNITAIGENAFAGISTLKKVTIGESVKTIHNNAFYNCVNLETIFNYRPTPTNAYSTAFDGVDKFECKLYVLPSSIDMYKAAAVWRDFYYTYAIGAEEATVTTNNVTVEPQDNAATLTWPTSENAATYTIEITKDGEVFCTLIFNANGQLTGIAFAPSRDGQAHAPAAIMTSNGLQFTVTGLNSNTQYGYNLTAKDANDQTVATYSGSFTTTSEGIATGVEDVQGNNVQCKKVVRDGQIFILRGNKTYTITGAEVR